MLNISILYFQVVLNIFHFGFIYIPLHFRPHSCRVGARDISLRNSISDFSEIISDHRKGISIVWEIFKLVTKVVGRLSSNCWQSIAKQWHCFFSISFDLLTGWWIVGIHENQSEMKLWSLLLPSWDQVKYEPAITAKPNLTLEEAKIYFH